MAPSKSNSKPKKEKIFHPDSRKAGQLARKQLRKNKLTAAGSKRGKKVHSKADVYGFWFHAIPDEGILTLEEMHDIVRNVWLARHDEELEEEKSARRKGRPKSAKETKLEEITLREQEDYRSGLEVPDLTHAPTVEVFRRWDQKEVAFIQLLRFIRISSTNPDVAPVTKPGKHFLITRTEVGDSNKGPEEGTEMDVDRSAVPVPAS